MAKNKLTREQIYSVYQRRMQQLKRERAQIISKFAEAVKNRKLDQLRKHIASL